MIAWTVAMYNALSRVRKETKGSMGDIRIKAAGNLAYVFSPYSREFVSRIKGIGGAKWDPGEKCWVVPANAVETCRKILLDVYGETGDGPVEYVNLKLTFKQAVSENLSSVVILGKTICRAYSHDSGGRPGEDVIFVEGTPSSGGSRNRWDSVVPAGSVVLIFNVPQALYQRFDPGTVPGLLVEEAGKDVDANRMALLAERERLLRRIEEINKELERGT